jgi:diguanylate cyclase (GGDEF)-like protein/PAS domain S-box-containing protein
MKSHSAGRQDAVQVESGQETAARPSFGKPNLNSEKMLGRFSDVAMLAADWFWEMDAELRFTYQSSRFEEITGIPVAEVIGKTREQAFAGRIDDADKWSRVGQALKQRKEYSMVWSLRRPDGQTRVLRTRARPFFDLSGRFMGYRGVGSDISDAATAQQQLIESENHFRNVIEHVTDIVCIVDADGEIKFLNNAVEKLLGYRVDELKSGQAGAHAIPEDRERIQQAVTDVLNDPELVVSGVYRYQHKDGSIKVLEVTRQQIRHFDSNQEVSIIVHARDVTSQHLAEQALKQSEDRLRDFAETGADWFWEQDADLRFTYLSGNYPGVERMAAEEIIGKTREEIAINNNFKAEKWRQLAQKLESREPFYNFEYSYLLHDGSEIVVRISGKPKFNDRGQFIGYRGTGIDITESYLLSQQLNYQASHDPLTGLVNRREFELRLSRVVKGCREDKSEHALCYIDLDQFKVVNDTCGHDAGDELLRQIAALLEDKVRKRDTIARLGGDEFGLLLERCTMNQANRVAETVREAIDQFRFMWAGRNFRLGASIGVIPINFSSGNIANVMRSADAACYTAKDAGRNRIHVYNEDSFEVAQRHQEMQRIVELNHAFDEGRFVLYQQPIHSLNPEKNGHGHFSEVLVRMIDEDGFPVLPANFLPTAERYNMAIQLDTWVVNGALDWLVSDPQVRCTINLSGMSIADEGFLRYMLEVIDEKEVDASRICLEITETAAIQNLTRANHFIHQLRNCGCYFALDDFGSGLSSFAYLKTLPVDYLKIDGFFVRDMVDDRINFELVKSINDVGHVMGKRTIAEFVENEATLDALRETGVDYAQGFSIAKPRPVKY